MKFNDAIAGAVLLALAATVFLHAGTFPAIPGQHYGPSLFPRLVACGLAAGAVVLIARGLAARAGGWIELAPWARDGRTLARIALILATMPLFALAADALGFIVVSLAILLATMAAAGVGWARAAAVAVAATLALDYAFGTLLRVPLPRGLIQSWWW